MTKFRLVVIAGIVTLAVAVLLSWLFPASTSSDTESGQTDVAGDEQRTALESPRDVVVGRQKRIGSAPPADGGAPESEQAGSPQAVPSLSEAESESADGVTQAAAQSQDACLPAPGRCWPEVESSSTRESSRMETEILNFLSLRPDRGMTSIADVRCNTTNCRLRITGLEPGDLAALMRELMADESLGLTDAGFHIPNSLTGIEAIELFLTYDANGLMNGVESVREHESAI